ncbi:unnamed protein product [Paramecium primaurelia]|uniref:Anaphase-promoting complex subunit 4-like WD40 domain-containing protein n=1 Tax=Paramecium primaurelia TaxID=5886 RepID=A0A8S1Q0L4_PARPR|nr:unnamed protein product [Paramecium primaurelia]
MNLQQWASGFQCMLGHQQNEYMLCISPQCPQVRKLICRDYCIPYYHKNHKVMELSQIEDFLNQFLNMKQPHLHESIIETLEEIEILRSELNRIIDSTIDKIKRHFGRFSYQAQKYAQEFQFVQQPERIEQLSKQIIEIATLKQDQLKIKIVKPLQSLNIGNLLKECIQKLTSFVIGNSDVNSVKPENLVGAFSNHIRTIQSDGEVWCLQPIKGGDLISGGDDNKIIIWNMNSLEKLWVSKKHRAIITSLAITSDSKVLVMGSSEGYIKFLDMETKKFIKKLKGHNDHVSSLHFNNQNNCLLSSGWDANLIMWNIDQKDIVMKLFKKEHEAKIYCVQYSYDNQIIASCSLDKTIRLWDIHGLAQIGQPLMGHSEKVDWIQFTPQYLISCSQTEKNIIVWDYMHRQQIWNFIPGNDPHRFAISPDGKLLACIRKEIRVFEISTRQQIGDSIPGHQYFAMSFNYSLDGRFLVSGCQDKTIRIYGIPK